jgi:hypothetical protein
MEDHLSLPMLIGQFLDEQTSANRQANLDSVQRLKFFSALEAIQSAAEATLEFQQINMHSHEEISSYWYVAFLRCDEVSESISYGFTIGEASTMVNQTRNLSLRQTNELIRHLSRTSRKVEEMFEGLGYLVR